MILLAIDTSGAYASVAVFDGAAVLGEVTWHARRRHDDHLFPAIERLLVLVGAELGDVRRVAVATGPGSFTGLRVGIAAAQGIVRASGVALVGVPTCDVVAYPFASSGRRVCVLIDAGRGEHYAAMYRTRRGVWGRTSDIRTVAIDDLVREVVRDTIFAGDVTPAMAEALRERLGRRAIVPSPSALVRRAGHLAEVGWARADAGESVEPDALEPVYIRPPTIRGPAGEIVAPAGPEPASAVRRTS
ncbi:MAG: tRNA (adenosine(37)-N6)-threonylcarbamoyltransferase complex dimerization subunit type 1 TsaB [Chloroflexota bacterium]|nr:tRNA (adenosine(37)-N6)-threonylcarbamoyltransferase complex dimerization subunit type 1 TsaB [Chloroflexota bacterium]MDE3101902.1 tRNA (adenosine(37)-N6)-threonylcarbamoyltransferase complex dimerization subunit type 1 TsaB [Chloroflexota bacterium]